MVTIMVAIVVMDTLVVTVTVRVMVTDVLTIMVTVFKALKVRCFSVRMPCPEP